MIRIMTWCNELRHLDRHNVGSWPRSAKLFFMALVMLMTATAGWSFHIHKQQQALRHAQTAERALKQTYAQNLARTAELPALQAQMDALQAAFEQALQQFPRKTEIPKLLADISHMAQAAGLATNMFEPNAEQRTAFYADASIHIKMSGTYRQFRQFIHDVASLPHMVILTLHDLSLATIGPASAHDDAPPLTLQGVVRTYRHVEGSE